ncbi:MAG: DNA (cytosine-5-)-methyltransferase [Patescibacteria group bacterium]|nr:DNA (cytosine-5-)-methyltransferase [Patescibacteria group bacterium]
MRRFKTIDLFAGIGGIRLAFEMAGFETVYANDFDKYCKITYDLNFKKPKLTLKDIKKQSEKNYKSVIDDLSELEYDVLLAGFPCQAFSIAGYREGFKDSKGRGDLFFYIAEIIEKTQPKVLFLENVKHLKTHDKGRTYKIIINTLTSIGYHTKDAILNAKEYSNIPQNRERIYIVGFKDIKPYFEFEFPEKLTLTKSVKDFLEKKVDDYYYYENKKIWEKIKNYNFQKYKIYQWRRTYIRENKNGVCPTLTANMGTGGHNVPLILDEKGLRKLTPKECFNLQGFPANFKLPKSIGISHLYKQAGNSVVVPLVKKIAENIKNVMIKYY